MLSNRRLLYHANATSKGDVVIRGTLEVSIVVGGMLKDVGDICSIVEGTPKALTDKETEEATSREVNAPTLYKEVLKRKTTNSTFLCTPTTSTYHGVASFFFFFMYEWEINIILLIKNINKNFL